MLNVDTDLLVYLWIHVFPKHMHVCVYFLTYFQLLHTTVCPFISSKAIINKSVMLDPSDERSIHFIVNIT